MERIILEVDEKTKKKIKVYAAQTDQTVKKVLVEGALLLMKENPAKTYMDNAAGGTLKETR